MNPQEPNNTISTQRDAKPSGRLAILFMAIFVILSLSAVAFLWYQNQQLKRMILDYQTQIQPSPTPVATNDSTSNWKTYRFEPINLELKVPADFTVEQSEPNKGMDFTAYIQNTPTNSNDPDEFYQLYVFWQKFDPITKTQFEAVKDELILNSIEETEIDGNYAIKGQIKGERNRFVTFILHNGNKISFFTSQPTEKNKIITDNILDTLRFLDASPTPISKACTMEAKICPDGSSVGRSGPNCEFSPCP